MPTLKNDRISGESEWQRNELSSSLVWKYNEATGRSTDSSPAPAEVALAEKYCSAHGYYRTTG